MLKPRKKVDYSSQKASQQAMDMLVVRKPKKEAAIFVEKFQQYFKNKFWQL